jgi:transposase
MKLHRNAALSWNGRRLLVERVVERGWTLTAAAAVAGVSVRCAGKWVRRYRLEGELGLFDRSSAPRSVANRTGADRVAVIVALRRLRMTAAEIAEALQMPLSTVSAILTREGLGRLGRIGLEQPVRYERSRPGELVHIDVKKLGRIQGGAGWRARSGPQHYNRTYTDATGRRRNTVGYEFVHVAIDDYSRLAYVEVLPDEKATTAIGFLRRALAFFARHGIRVERVSPTTAPPTSRPCTRSPAAASASATCAPAPTGRRPTAKPNASSAPSSTAGPTAPSTAPAKNAPPPLTAGSGTTTIADDTQPSATDPRSAEPTCLGPTTKAASLSLTRANADPLVRSQRASAQTRTVHEDPDQRCFRRPLDR